MMKGGKGGEVSVTLEHQVGVAENPQEDPLDCSRGGIDKLV